MQINTVAATLQKWYSESKRDLPFRATTDPYKIWISEVMLQQTQIKTVIPYYNRWIDTFPNIQIVANSKLDSLLKIWEGLGYYRRCVNFHNATKIVLKNYNGKIPSDYNTFIKLPGVGKYTAGAVLSISFGVKIPAIDVNVFRVISRFQCLNKSVNNNKTIYNLISSMLGYVNSPGDFNQALMDLGSLICIQKNPKCKICPISTHCKAYLKNQVDQFPKISKTVPKPHYDVVVGMIWYNNKFYIQKRSLDSMLAGLWEFPGGKVDNGEPFEIALKRGIENETGFIPIIGDKIDSIKHTYSHFSISLHCFQCFVKNKKLTYNRKFEWITPKDIKKFSFPKANHKLFNLISQKNWYV